jgi:hypothetical protein
MPEFGQDVCVVCTRTLFPLQERYCTIECEQFDLEIKEQFHTDEDFVYSWGINCNGSIPALHAGSSGSNPLSSTKLRLLT